MAKSCNEPLQICLHWLLLSLTLTTTLGLPATNLPCQLHENPGFPRLLKTGLPSTVLQLPTRPSKRARAMYRHLLRMLQLQLQMLWMTCQ